MFNDEIATINRMNKIIENNCDNIMRNPEIIGIGIGKKIIKGIFTEIPTLTVIVKKKLMERDLNNSNKIPKFLYGVLTDVIEGGEISNASERVKPACGGVSIGNDKLYKEGTLAYAVTDKKTRQSLYALSCMHVLSTDYTGNNGEVIIQPGNVVGEINDSYPLGIFTRGIKLKIGVPKNQRDYNEVDAAIAYVGPNNEKTKKNLIEPLLKKRIISNISKVKSQDEIFKIGAETGETQGSILTVGTSIKITIDRDEMMFKNQITAKIDGKKGDSGALGMRTKDFSAFGMLIGVNDNGICCFNPIDKVLDALQVELAN